MTALKILLVSRVFAKVHVSVLHVVQMPYVNQKIMLLGVNVKLDILKEQIMNVVHNVRDSSVDLELCALSLLMVPHANVLQVRWEILFLVEAVSQISALLQDLVVVPKYV